MGEKDLEKFIDLQKRSSWFSVDEGIVNGKTERVAFPSRRINYEKYLINMIDAEKLRERRRHWKKFRKS